MICSRGYSCERYESLKSAYFNKPTPLQTASYQTHLIQMLQSKDPSTTEALRQALSSGISPNACNAFGESLVHMMSRRGDAKGLQILIDNGCNLQVADDYGRTPLHDCCWAADPAIEVADIILAADPRLFYMADLRGSVPLSYVRKEYWPLWIDYLESKKDIIWPTRNLENDSAEGAPALTLLAANSRPLQDPENALPVELATMVASGKMKPEEAQFLKGDETGIATCDFSDSGDEDDYSDYDSEDSLDESEMDMADSADDMPLHSKLLADCIMFNS
jgi:hypothetical protein